MCLWRCAGLQYWPLPVAIHFACCLRDYRNEMGKRAERQSLLWHLAECESNLGRNAKVLKNVAIRKRVYSVRVAHVKLFYQVRALSNAGIALCYACKIVKVLAVNALLAVESILLGIHRQCLEVDV